MKKKKEWYKNNKNIINQKHKEYRKNNKEILNEKQRDKITCECGCEIVKRYLSTHLKSKKHIKLMI